MFARRCNDLEIYTQEWRRLWKHNNEVVANPNKQILLDRRGGIYVRQKMVGEAGI